MLKACKPKKDIAQAMAINENNVSCPKAARFGCELRRHKIKERAKGEKKIRPWTRIERGGVRHAPYSTGITISVMNIHDMSVRKPSQITLAQMLLGKTGSRKSANVPHRPTSAMKRTEKAGINMGGRQLGMDDLSLPDREGRDHDKGQDIRLSWRFQ